jgi:hypothetical protein
MPLGHRNYLAHGPVTFLGAGDWLGLALEGFGLGLSDKH